MEHKHCNSEISEFLQSLNMQIEVSNHQTNNWIYDVYRFRFSINDIDFAGKLTRPIKVKLRGIAGKESWSKSNLELGTFRTSVDGILHVDGYFELPKGTQVGQYGYLELKYKTKRRIGSRGRLSSRQTPRGLCARLHMQSRTQIQLQ
jgi:hypothetical protein